MKGYTYSKRRPFNALFATAPLSQQSSRWDASRQALANATSECVAVNNAYRSASGSAPVNIETTGIRRAANAYMRYPASRKSYSSPRCQRLGGKK